MISLKALEVSGMPVSGATGALLKRSLTAVGNLVSRALDEVRSGVLDQRETFSVATLLADAYNDWEPRASLAGSTLKLPPVDAALTVRGDRELLLAALGEADAGMLSVRDEPGVGCIFTNSRLSRRIRINSLPRRVAT